MQENNMGYALAKRGRSNNMGYDAMGTDAQRCVIHHCRVLGYDLRTK